MGRGGLIGAKLLDSWISDYDSHVGGGIQTLEPQKSLSFPENKIPYKGLLYLE